jgi:hypothetical protein
MKGAYSMSNNLIKRVSFGVIAMATLIAAPAMAQSRPEPIPQRAAQPRQDDGARGAFASDLRQHSPDPAWDVYSPTGVYIGSDPDPLIRAQLAWDFTE